MELVTLTKRSLPRAVLSRAGQDLARFPGKLGHGKAVHSTRAVQDQPFPGHHWRPWRFSPAGVKAPQPHGNGWLGPAGVAALCLSFPSMASASSGTAAVPSAHFPPPQGHCWHLLTPSHGCHHPMSSHQGDPGVLGPFKVICQGQAGWMWRGTSSGLTGSSQLPSARSLKRVCVS